MGQTSIPCDSDVRDRLAEDKPDDQSWSEYLSVLHSDQEIVVDGGGPSEVTLDGGVISDIANETARKTAEELEGRLR